MDVSIINPILDERWDNFVNEQPDSTIFHHSAWAKVLRDRYGGEPVYFIEENNKRQIAAGIPFFCTRSLPIGKRLVSLPCSEYCYPLGPSDSISRLLDVAKEEVLSKKVSFVEIRGWTGPAADDVGFYPNSKYLSHVTILYDDVKTLRASLEKENYHLKRNLKRAETSKVSVREGKGEIDLREFHKLNVETRRRLNLLPWPYPYLESIYRHMILPGHGFLLLAELDGQIIAGSMYFVFKDTVLLKFNASRKEFTEYRPNYLITWKAMERSCIEGRKFFDFGITDSNNAGLLSFKRQWAARETAVAYYYYPAVRGANSLPRNGLIYKTYLAFNRMTPQVVLNTAARVLYRHLG
jgi:lipid II:glycine glycyltransferase (peptidoglycan interpeptide bridge formation enzyme)